jgi:hypothetical protein
MEAVVAKPSYYPDICLEELRKTMHDLRIARIPAKI